MRSATRGRWETSPALLWKSKKVLWFRGKSISVNLIYGFSFLFKLPIFGEKLWNVSLRGLSFVCCRWNVYRSALILPLFSSYSTLIRALEPTLPWKIPDFAYVETHLTHIYKQTLPHLWPMFYCMLPGNTRKLLVFLCFQGGRIKLED